MVPSLGLEALLSGKINRFLFAKRWGTNGVCESDVFPWHTSNIETHTHLGKTNTHSSLLYVPHSTSIIFDCILSWST